MKKALVSAIVFFASAFGFAPAHAQSYMGQPGGNYQTYQVQTPPSAPLPSYQAAAPQAAPSTPPLYAQQQQPYSASSSSTGGFFSPISDRIVSDPLYLPLKGQIYGVTAYSYGMPSGDNYKAGVKQSSFTASDNTLTQLLAYGLSDHFMVRVSTNYAFDQRDTDATGTTSTNNANGFTDPTFSMTYRVLDQPQHDVIFDLTASYEPDMIDSKASAGTGNDGTVARGGQLATVDATLGREMKNFTIAGTATATYSGQQMTELLSNDTYVKSAPYWSFGAGVNTQTRFTDRLSLNVGAAYSSINDYNVTNLGTGAAHTATGTNTLDFTAGLNYHFIPNRLVGSLTYTYDDYMDSQNLFAVAANDTEVLNYQGSTFGARLYYVFN